MVRPEAKCCPAFRARDRASAIRPWNHIRDGNGAPFSLHGLNAVRLPGTGWYRVDPRGNRDGVDAQCIPPREQLAFSITIPGEADLPEVWPDPLPVVVDALTTHTSAADLWLQLPDLPLWSSTA